MLEDSLVSYGDLIPTANLRWNQGVNNYMVYVTGDVPVGDYRPERLANLGIGHGAIDAGGGYTYFNPATGMNYRALPVSPTISKIPTRSTAAGWIFTSTGARRTSSRSRFLSGLPDMPISRLPTTPAKTRFWAASDQASSASVRSSDTSSPWGTCRAFSA